MENQRILLYAGLGFILLLLWQNWQLQYGPKPEQAVVNSQSLNNTNTSTPQINNNLANETPSQISINDSTAPVVVSNSAKISIETDVFNVEVDTTGGTVSKVELIKYPVSITEKETPFSLMSDDPAKYFVFQSGLLDTKNSTPSHQSTYSYEKTNYKMDEGQSKLSVPLVWKSEDGTVEVIKTLHFTADSYRIDVEYSVNNLSSDALVVNQYRQLQRKPVTDNETQQFIYTYIGGVISSAEDPYDKITFDDMEDSDLSREVNGGWQAMIQHYFVGAVVPSPDETNTFYTKSLNSPKRYILGMQSNTKTIAANSSSSFNTTFYIGPKDQERLESVADKLNLVVDFGWLTIIANPIFWLLKKIHSFIGNWGWSIIILTMIIKGIFYKLSEASYKSMARMRNLQPKLQALKEQYGSDRQAIGQKTMELYKTEKVNPLGGCLPMIIQIPVFIALYWVLLESVEIRQAPWILWIEDMSIKDPYFVLPVIMGITMFFQQKLSPAMVTDPVQQKVFMFLPLVFTVFFAFFPAGLVLYWVVNNTLTIAQQYYITRYVVGDGK